MGKGRIVFYSLLGLVVVSAVYFRFNAPSIYGQFGDYNYRLNNVHTAQKFYEKSFDLGNKSYKQRENYVSSIINSPLTIEAQEKLVKIAEDSIQDTASVRAKSFLYDLKREVHKNYPLNYIKQAPHNQKIVRWGKYPVTYKFKTSSNVPPEFIQEIERAFNEWEKESEHQVLFSKTNKNDANILIDFQTSEASNWEYGRKFVVAYTTPEINQDKLDRMVIKFYLQDPEGKTFTRNQIYNTALHEIFHALGFMGHSYDKENIMYLAKDNNVQINDLRDTLTEADITTLKLLYKIKPDITNSNVLKSDYIPYLILGDEEDINYSKAKEAKNYIYQAPSLPGGYIDYAESLVAQKKYPEAIRNLEKALSLASSNDTKYIIFYNLAVSYFYINHLEMALDYAHNASKIKDSEELHFLFAEIYLRQENYPKFIEEYNYLIKTSPDNINYVINLANFYVKRYNYLRARKVLKDYIKNNPKEKNNPRLSPYGILLF